MHDEASRLDRECFWVLCLDAGNKVIGINLVSMGTLNSSLIHSREVFKPALLVGSNSVILVHNHPLGNLKASTEDTSITNTLKGAGDILGIKVLDHVIIADTGYVSLKEIGYM
jgi:DNA repair protein RadC